MEKWQGLAPELKTKYSVVRVIKRTAEKELVLLQNIETERRSLLRNYPGKALPVYLLLAEKKLQHIPQIYCVQQKEEGFYVLEEFIEGTTLHANSVSYLKFPEILRQLCLAISELHAFHVVHRDIKPENILCSENGEVYLLDLDAARIYKPYCDQDTSNLGTAGYAAPEQFGIMQTDERADIFSLGVCMNVLLTGHHPSEKLCSGWMKHVVSKCTQIDPNSRYQTANQVWRAACICFIPHILITNWKTSFLIAALLIAILLGIGILWQHTGVSSTIAPYNDELQNSQIGLNQISPSSESVPPTEATPANTTPSPNVPTVSTITLSDPSVSEPSQSYTPPKMPAVPDSPTIPAVPTTVPTTPAPTLASNPTLAPEPEAKPTAPTTPSADPNDITQKERYDEVHAAYIEYCKASAKSLNAMDDYEAWKKEPYYPKNEVLENNLSQAQIAWDDAHANAALKKEALEVLESADSPNDDAIQGARIAYDSAVAAEKAAEEKRLQAQQDLIDYQETAEYLNGKQEEDRLWRTYKEFDSIAGEKLVYLNNLEEKYDIYIPIWNDSYDPYR